MRFSKPVEKKNLIYCIDRITVFPLPDCYRLCMRGWAFLKEDGAATVMLEERGDIQNLILGQVARGDVSMHYSQYENIANCGFECRFDFGADPVPGQTLELYLAGEDSGTRERFFSISFEKLLQYRLRPGISCQVEEANFLGGRIVASGYAYANLAYRDCRRPKIRVLDASGREVLFTLSDVTRLDVEQMTGQPESRERLGFRIEWQAKADETYRLVFEEGDYRKSITVNEMGARRMAYYGKKAARRGARAVKRLLHIGGKSYRAWEKEHRVTRKEWERQREEQFASMPTISIVVPAYRTPEKFLREMIDSVRGQSYENWELCIGDGSADESIAPILEEYARGDKRIKYKRLAENYGISGNTNEALKLATGEYLSLLDHDDLLAPDVLYEVVRRINETGAEVLYTDEDKVTMDRREYFEPHFKPDYSPELLHSCNYICHFFVVKRNVFERVGAFREECNGSQDYDYILRCTRAANRVEHIARILYHWRCHPNSTAGDPESKMYCYEAGKRALELDLAAREIRGAKVSIDAHFGYYRVTYPVRSEKTAVVILTDGNEELKELTADSVRHHTRDLPYELVEAELKEGISAAFNRAAKETDAHYIVFLQAGMTARGSDWLQIMLGNCQREEIGAVGATVLVNGRYVAHSGKAVGLNGEIAKDFFAGNILGDPGYAGRMLAQQDVRGLSWKGMMVKRSALLEAGGFDEKLQKLYMDIDLCLKLRKSGKRIVYTPYTEWQIGRPLWYAETKNSPEDEARMREIWSAQLTEEDPYYNKNFSDRDMCFSRLG